MKLYLTSENGTVLGAYYIGDTDEFLVDGDLNYVLPTQYIERHPRGAALDLGKAVLRDVAMLKAQGHE